ncbi:MAG: putative Ig domain-containing protein, partial [Synergistaceae bacterium]|nr:putative Ig domain-containing protein [Synergistaceae bacterium]
MIDNYPEAQTLTCIDQSLCYYTPEESDRVGTRIRYSVSYGEFSKGNYVPMYVTYPDDKPDGIKISDTFPDELFREYVSYWDTNKDGYFSDDEIDKVTDFGWYGGPHPDNEYENAWPYWEPKGVLESRVGKDHWKGIKSVEGVKIFKNLEALYVYNDNITGTLDVSGMTKLKDLRCWNDTYAGGNITEINAQGCTALEHLECQGNKLTSLNVYGCTALNHLECQDNRLTYLNTTNCTSLKEIRMWNNSFTSITLSNLPSLEELWAADCKSMKKLYVKNNPKMTRLYVDKNSALEEIYASGSGKLNSFLFDGCNSLKKFERDSSVNLSAYVPKITTTSLPRGYVGENYSATVKASGIGVITYSGTATFVANGFYFYGGSLYTENTTGRIRGVPVTAATRSYTITASNFAGSTSKNYSITVINNGKGPKITTAFLSNGVKGRYYSVPIAETGGIAPITWARVSGTLPPGTKLGTSGRTVYLSGTPTATGTYTFRVQAADSTSTPVLRLPLYDMKEFTVRIRNPLAFSDGIRDGLQGSSGQGFGSGVVKQAYTGKITVSGGASPYTLSSSGTLPNGSKLSLSGSTVTLSGLPTKAGKYTFTVKIKDSDGNLLEKTYTVNVTQTTISGTIPSTVVRGASVTWTLTASGGTSPYTWSIDSGKLPDGLSINKSTGKITGKPTKAGTYTFVIKATDANKVAATKSYTVKITQTAISGTFTATGVVKAKYNSA